MIEMVRRFLRQRFGSPAMAIALGVLALLTALQAIADPERALGAGFLAIVLIGAGSVSKDASGGALQMILARPIRRTSYLFGRYLGIVAAYAIFLVASGGLSILFARALPRLFGGPAAPPAFAAGALGRGAATALLNALLFAAILLFFSTFMRGYADVLAYVGLSILLQALPGLGHMLQKPWLANAGEAIRKNVLPEVDWSQVLRGQNMLGEASGRYVLAVTGFLILAAVVFSRREFAYGQD